ncbi:Inhibitor of growth protein [Fasciola hepatica]|uniref:Inhibitor of growth protein n=1 Tax=Fasciola hepatica TaxID=6192 RepID=A0A4E0RWJ2_FASHE|nr:Inhibitor of growth protein [Fasciola hepatica]
MLYFEDFMEGMKHLLFDRCLAIENLPAELSESLTTVRQLDLLVQNSLESLHEVTKAFFEDCKYDRLSDFDKSLQHSEVMKEYDKALAYCREKRDIVEKIYTTYTKLVRKLDAELEKFRLELEADNSGITEQIEQRTNAILGRNAAPIVKVEKRRQRFRFQQPNHFKNPFLVRRRIVGQAYRTVLKSATGRPNHSHKAGEQLSSRFARVHTQRSLRTTASFHQVASKRLNSSIEPSEGDKLVDDGEFPFTLNFLALLALHSSVSHSFAYSGTRSDYSNTPTTKSDLEADQEDLPEFGNSLSSLTTKSSPFFTLGAQTDVSTPTSDRTGGRANTGRHTASSDFAYPQPESSDRSMNSSATSTTVHGGGLSDSRFPSDQCPANWPVSAVGLRERRARTSRRPARETLLDELIPDALRTTDPVIFDETASSGPGSTTDGIFDPGTVGFVQDMKLDNPDDGLDEDEDEKRYCWCHNVSYGDMIACDAPNCPYEWFHYGCVNLTVAPKGSWYCPSCVKSQSGMKGFKKRVSRK